MRDWLVTTPRLVRTLVGTLALVVVWLLAPIVAIAVTEVYETIHYPTPTVDDFNLDVAFVLFGVWCVVMLFGSSSVVSLWLSWMSLPREWTPSAGPHCNRCAYDLRGTTSDTCPECGNPVAPRDER